MRFEPDIAGARAGFLVLDRGEYELQIIDSEPFSYVKDNGDEVAGVHFHPEVVGRVNSSGDVEDFEETGERAARISCYVHSKKSWGMTKQFLMAALGYTTEEEEEFNEEWANDREFFIEGEGEDVQAADSWSEPVGQRVRVTADKELYEGREQQRWRSIRPIPQ